MYEECFRRSPRRQASSSSASVSDTSSACSSSGVTRHPPSLRASRNISPLVHGEVNTQSELWGPTKTWQRRGDTHSQFGDSAPLDRFEARRPCTCIYPTQNKVAHDQDGKSWRPINLWNPREKYGYDTPYVTGTLQEIPGSPRHKKRPCSLNEEENIEAEACSRLRVVHDRTDQSPASPQSSDSLLSLPPRWSTNWSAFGSDGMLQGSSSGTPYKLDNVPVTKRAAAKRQPTSSHEALAGDRRTSCGGALVAPFRLAFDWACFVLGLARSPARQSRSWRETSKSGIPVRSSETACPKYYECSQEADSDTECVSDSWSTTWPGTEDEGEESEVEVMLCAPPPPKPQMDGIIESCCCQSNQSCEEHLHLDVELHEYEKLLQDHPGAPGYLHQRTAGSNNHLVLSGSPTIPHATFGLPTVRSSIPHNHGGCPSTADAECVFHDKEGNIRLICEDEYCGVLLSDHMHPRWRHYRFTALNVANSNLLIEERVPVTYLDEEMAEAEMLKEMSDARKPQLERGAIDWKDVRWRLS